MGGLVTTRHLRSDTLLLNHNNKWCNTEPSSSSNKQLYNFSITLNLINVITQVQANK